MIATYRKTTSLALASAGLLPVALILSRRMLNLPTGSLGIELLFALAGGLLAWTSFRGLEALEGWIDEAGLDQAQTLDAMSGWTRAVAIVGSAGLSLFLEIVLIRWHASVFEVFSFYKSLTLIFVFAGLGLGYSLADRDRIPLVATAPLLAVQFAVLLGTRHLLPPALVAGLRSTPFPEQLDMGLVSVTSWTQIVTFYAFLAVVLLLTVLAFLPIGQACGRLLTGRPPLEAYGFNLAGSLAGVAATHVLGMLWTSPTVWFGFGLAGLLSLQGGKRNSLVCAGTASLLATGILAWPVSFSWQQIYSPYQLVELGHQGFLTIRAAGHYYQRMVDLRPGRDGSRPEVRSTAAHYDWPHAVHPAAKTVAIVGAGSGNDVAAALHAGATRVDAVEIDPVIVSLGQVYHPERPYSDPRVRIVVDDARSFFRTTRERFDLIVYGLLDSHTLLAPGASVRLDSFVYTIEGIREARSRLAPGGVVTLSFAVMHPDMTLKIHKMMTAAFDGHAPIVVRDGYDGAMVFAQAVDGDLTLDPEVARKSGFEVTPPGDATGIEASTDDWPFLYIARRAYPYSYLGLSVLVLGIVVPFASALRVRAAGGGAPFFLMGAGFMLVETKAITELGLAFGGTTTVVGAAIAGVLVMASAANLVAGRVGRLCDPRLSLFLVCASLVGGLLVGQAGGFAPTAMGRLATVGVLTVPLFFAGLAFSGLLLTRTTQVAGALAANLVGSLAGGLVEHTSLYFGLRALYGASLLFYVAALAAVLLGGRSQSADVRAL